jgi:hypothetical protein
LARKRARAAERADGFGGLGAIDNLSPTYQNFALHNVALAGDTTIGHTTAYCQAVEGLSGCKPPLRAQANLIWGSVTVRPPVGGDAGSAT